MKYPIQVFRGDAQEHSVEVPFFKVVRISLERLLRCDLSAGRLRVQLVDVPDYTVAPATPRLENRVPEMGYAQVSVAVGGEIVYRHPHSVQDLVTDTLRLLLLELDPHEMLWSYRLDLPGMPSPTAYRPAPIIPGAMELGSEAPATAAAFTIRRLADREPPACSLQDFGLTPGSGEEVPPVQVLVPVSLAEELLRQRPFSPEVEEGGFLVGRLYQDADRPGAHLVEITEAPVAAYTGASLLHFTFTGESFVDVRRSLRERQSDERLVGWYHTHLFAATPDFGLSSIDVTLHFGTFTFPWQVAGLVNVDGDARTLRFYIRQGREMAQCVHRTFDERSRHSTAGA